MLTRPEVFDEDYRPHRLLHREREVETLVRASYNPGAGTLVHGPSGVGKTLVATHVLDRLERERDLQTAHVPCLGATTASVLRSVLRQLPGPDPPANTPREDLSLQVFERVDEPTVVVCDEGDHLHGIDALARLFDVEWLSVVVVCHDADEWLAVADDDLRRRFDEPGVELERYGVSELADILEARAELGLAEASWQRRDLERIADEVAGIARQGIQTLREAARAAEEYGYARLRRVTIDDGKVRAQRRILRENLYSLPAHHQILYELIRQVERIEAGELHDRYEAVADAVYADQLVTPVGRRARRRKLNKLEDYGLIEAGGEGKGRVYRVVDRDIGPPPGIEVPPVE